MITEVVFTALFILVIAGTTRTSAIAGFAGIPIGLMLALIHMVTIPIDNTSVNPARSFATVLFGQSWGWEQLWVFIVFPIIGGVIGALIWRFVTTVEDETAPVRGPDHRRRAARGAGARSGDLIHPRAPRCLKSGTTYWYRLVAVNAVGAGPVSNTVSVTAK